MATTSRQTVKIDGYKHLSVAGMLRLRQGLGGAPKPSRGQYRAMVLVARDGDTCGYCGVELTDSTRTIDHRYPVLLGGPDGYWNLVLACFSCNTRKGHEVVEGAAV